jgi:hypothetical protein
VAGEVGRVRDLDRGYDDLPYSLLGFNSLFRKLLFLPA